MDTILGKTYSQLNVGDTFAFPPVAVTAELIDAFASLTGDHNLLHVNEEFARSTRFGGRIAHGMLTASLALAPLGDETFNGTALAMTGSAWKFRKAVRAGDQVATTAVVSAREPGKKGAGGKVTFAITACDGAGEKVLEGEAVVIIRD